MQHRLAAIFRGNQKIHMLIRATESEINIRSGVLSPKRKKATSKTWLFLEMRESAGKPGSVVDSHSSRPALAHWLKQPTRVQCGPHQ
ncbi:hypothetical protein PLESHI_05027 [Plesiomonas shigelloides 302-73]|uniref:Uncharacterized protein n=1 Tax=Plesiomonas shigelloides 302-73 TaxID=1315976 RepID=R8AT90_PLESH|nr:hypothetical protein PLESHI_05027 [Plesiomonas shigelloides 302-73]